MSHPTSAAIRDAGDDVVAHLEWCERCRASVEIDVDLAAVRRSIVAEIAETAAPAGVSPATGGLSRPWLVAVVSAVAVLALFAPVAFRAMTADGHDVAQSEEQAMERMLASEQGELLPLADGDGWSVSIARRGPGFCVHTETSGFGYHGGSESCLLESQMDVPAVMAYNAGLADDGVAWEWVEGQIVGVTAADVDRVSVRFDSGESRDVLPGTTVELGYRGFGLGFEVAGLGIPVEIEALHGAESLGAHAVDLPNLDLLRAVQEEPRLLATGEGWSVLIARRGPGYCLSAGGGIAPAAGDCWVESTRGVPEPTINVSSTSTEGPDGEEVIHGIGLVYGLVPADVDRAVVRFGSGAQAKAHLGDAAEFGYRGFGLTFDSAETGRPAEIELFRGTVSLGVEHLDVLRRGPTGSGSDG